MKCLKILFILIVIKLIHITSCQDFNTTTSRKLNRNKSRNSHRKRLNSNSSGSLPLWFNGYPKPVWIENPTAQTVIKGSTVNIECTCLTEAPVTINWKKNGETFDAATSKNLQSQRQVKFNKTIDSPLSNSQLLPSSMPNNMVKVTSTLRLVDIEDSDQGEYRCVGTNDHGFVESQKAQITMYSMPSFHRTPSDITTQVGSNARLECSADGAPTPVISWSKNSGNFPAASERRVQISRNGETFFLTDVKVSDMGTYSCTATNQAGTVVTNATVTVLQNPHFERPMSNIKAIEGDTAIIECAASASPNPNYKWTKDNAPVPMTQRHFITANQQLLVILDASIHDSGVYGCHVSNELGAVEQYMHLSVTATSYRAYFILCSITIILFLICICLIVIKCIGIDIFTHKSAHSKAPSPSPPGSPVLTTSLTEQTDISITPDIAHYTTIDSPDEYDDPYVVSVNDTYSTLDKKCNISF